jgi:glycosyltransferase involved in cell wall biosynthesis
MPGNYAVIEKSTDGFNVTVTRHLNVLISNTIRGDAKRIVLETFQTLHKMGGVSQKLFLLSSGREDYQCWNDLSPTFVEATGEENDKGMNVVANQVHQSPVPVLYTHLVGPKYLQSLWELGVSTIPVVYSPATTGQIEATSYNRPEVPFVVTVSKAVASELKKTGCERPIVTIRHEVKRGLRRADLHRYRKEIRSRHGIDDQVLLIGMVGEFTAEKAYTRAARILRAVQGLCRAKLVILGGWNGPGRIAYEAFCRAAISSGVIADVLTLGDVGYTEPYLAAFDVFLNTSVFEGLSIALLEAIQTGCPIVAADIAGNREILPPTSVLVSDCSDTGAYVEGIRKVITRSERGIPARPSDPFLVPRLWSSVVTYGISTTRANQIGRASGTLFITNDLNIGGPQRSIVNLLCRLAPIRKSFLGVLGEISVNSFKADLEKAEVPIFRADKACESFARAEWIALWADRLNVRNICFWNVNAEVKLALAKILFLRDLRLIDVSPGPMLFEELASAVNFQKRICLDAEQYFQRLDYFVALYADGVPPVQLCPDSSKMCVIPLGVPEPPSVLPRVPSGPSMLARQYDPQYAIGTCCRIVPQKRIESLIQMMADLSIRLPKASLTVVGGPDSRTIDYMSTAMADVRRAGLNNIFFVGPHENVWPFLNQFKVFVMTGDKQGCPNASLEAMAMKVPVVTDCGGGTVEQIEDGVNGFLVSDPSEMSYWVETLLLNGQIRESFGQAAQQMVRSRFSMQTMVERYLDLLE